MYLRHRSELGSRNLPGTTSEKTRLYCPAALSGPSAAVPNSATTEQKNYQKNYEDRSHIAPFLPRKPLSGG